MTTARTRITLPATAAPGEVVEIRTLIAHPMESGQRVGADGRMVPRDILRRFSCRVGDETVFAVDLHPAIAANPYLQFTLRASATATLTFRWEGDNGFVHTETRVLAVA